MCWVNTVRGNQRNTRKENKILEAQSERVLLQHIRLDRIDIG